MSKPTVRIDTITPDKARQWIEKNNKGNRRVSQGRVKILVDQIEKGQFTLSPDAIAFNDQGRLFNGQHRLYACVQSGKSIEAIVLQHADPDSFMITDIGMKKNGGHALGTLGYANASHMAAAARMVYIIDSRGIKEPWGQLAAISPNQISAVVKKHPLLAECVEQAQYLVGRDKLKTSRTVVALALWIASTAAQYDPMLEFLKKVAAGFDLKENSPEITLRRKLLNDSDKRVTTEITKEHVALLCKAYRLNKTGKQSKVLSWKTSDNFPIIESDVPE